MIHHLYRTTMVSAPVANVWDFISTPRNLNHITPENLSFIILSEVPEKMYEGLLIQYHVNIPLFGRWSWLTEIKHIRDGKSFVDEQRSGPYKFWYHYHEVQAFSDGTKIIDQLTYQIPLGFLGDLVNAMIIKRQLDEIFNYREGLLKKIFQAGKYSN